MRSFVQTVFICGISLLYANTASSANPPPITFSSSRTLNFGNVTKQTGADVTATVASNSSSRGQLRIRDGNNTTQTINITFQSCGLTADKVRVKDFTATYGSTSWTVSGDGPFTQSGLPNPPSNGTQLRYGATLLVTKDAKVGALTPCFYITMQYDCVPATCSNTPVVDNDTANVVVLSAPMDLIESQKMTFGPLSKPTTNSVILLQPTGALSVSSGNAAILGFNAGRAATFTLVAEKGVTVSVYATQGSAVSGLRLNNMTAIINGGSTVNINSSGNAKAFVANQSGTNTINVGASLEMTASSVTNGSKTVPYTITFTYQ